MKKMNEEQINWSKTVLMSYRYLGKLCNTIDRLVESTAKNSMFTNSYWQSECSITNVFEKISKLSNKKIDYINLKLTIEKALKKLPEKSAKILILKYVQGINVDEISNLLNIPSRTIYRKLDNAVIQLTEELETLGYSSEFLEVTFFADTFISSVYDTIKNKEQCSKRVTKIYGEDIFGKLLHDFALNPI